MDTGRIKQLEKYVEEEPNDPFPKYALALEYQATYPSKAIDLFENLLLNHPDYTATYYHAAALYAEVEAFIKAKATYERGIELLEQIPKEVKALQELRNAYQNFLFETED